MTTFLSGLLLVLFVASGGAFIVTSLHARVNRAMAEVLLRLRYHRSGAFLDSGKMFCVYVESKPGEDGTAHEFKVQITSVHFPRLLCFVTLASLTSLPLPVDEQGRTLGASNDSRNDTTEEN